MRVLREQDLEAGARIACPCRPADFWRFRSQALRFLAGSIGASLVPSAFLLKLIIAQVMALVRISGGHGTQARFCWFYALAPASPC